MNTQNRHSTNKVPDTRAERQKKYRILRDGLIDAIGRALGLAPTSRPTVLNAALKFINDHNAVEHCAQNHLVAGRKPTDQAARELEADDVVTSFGLTQIARSAVVGSRNGVASRGRQPLQPLAELIKADG